MAKLISAVLVLLAPVISVVTFFVVALFLPWAGFAAPLIAWIAGAIVLLCLPARMSTKALLAVVYLPVSSAVLFYAALFGSWRIFFPLDPVYGKSAIRTQAEVLKIVPVGSTVAFAKATMESKGFHCSMEQGPYVSDDPVHPTRQIYHPPADHLWCDSNKAGGFLTEFRWQVMLVISNDAVASVDAAVSSTGL